MNKKEAIAQMYANTLNELASNSEKWIQFLQTSARMYRHDFDSQVLIFAQKPKATALLSFDDWHKIFNRRIKAGSKGIGVFDNDNHNKIKYYFDIASTKPQPDSPDVNIWNLEQEYISDVIISLGSHFDELFDTNNLTAAVETSTDILIDNDVTGNINLLLEDIDDDKSQKYIDTIKASVNYMVLSRCNQTQALNQYVQEIKNLFPFDEDTINRLGEVISTAAEMELVIISKEIKKIMKQIKEEKTNEHRDKLHRGTGRYAVSGLGGSGGGEPVHREIREHVQELLAKAPQNTVRQVKDERSSNENVLRQERGDSREGGRAGSTDGGKRGSERRTEKERPSQVGRSYEQPDSGSRGNNSSGIPLQLKEKNAKAEEQTSSAFSVLKEDKANTIPSTPQLTFETSSFNITDSSQNYGGAKEKFKNNMAAVKLLHKLQRENRPATPEEQNILAKYVGWGGLSMAFDENNKGWSKEFQEARDVLSEAEYASAVESTLTAFYTPPFVIKSIYTALGNMGFKGGKVLEPSCGIGSFISYLPDNMQDSDIHGVELDKISGEIARLLHPKANIIIDGFEKVQFNDNFFDIAIGNVPFGQYKLNDKRYDKNNFLIHDYFFAKVLDKVKPGGIIAFITSKGTMDKKNSEVRRYIAKRAELLGAIRLPDNTFAKNAGTKVTSDIIFLQKRDKILDITPSWVNLEQDENGIAINSYFTEHPEMILGKMEMVSTQYGMDSACKAHENSDLEHELKIAAGHIYGKIRTEIDKQDKRIDEVTTEVNAINFEDLDVKNHSYFNVDGKLYFKDSNTIKLMELPDSSISRINSMIGIRDCLRKLIEYQTEDYSDNDIQQLQQRLNILYDDFSKHYGLINSSKNKKAFSEDNSYPLLCSLENINGEGQLESKSDIFFKRTINPKKKVTSVNTAKEALITSLNERAYVDMPFMQHLYNKSELEIEAELKGIIYRVPYDAAAPDNGYVFQSADEYLSGNVRTKLKEAEMATSVNPLYDYNVQQLKRALPKDLSPSKINVRLGATWIPASDIEDFVHELLNTPLHLKHQIKVHYSKFTGSWQIEGKSQDKLNVKANSTYGTKRINAYEIILDTLNLKNIQIYDYIEDEKGNTQAVINRKETAIALGKQDIIKEAFKEWIWKDPNRRERLSQLYNKQFNSIVPRNYDGSYLDFHGKSALIELREHQKNAVARIIFGKNTLLAHVVGAGKTYSMVAGAMESKKLGLCNKSMVVVPNHIIEQFATEWMQLYPGANILVATEKDFSPENRKKFCSRIATSDIDAVIIGHSQFERIPLSQAHQKQYIQEQIDEAILNIEEAKKSNADNFSVKQLAKLKKNLEYKLTKLNDQSIKDDVITFEELGCDRLFVDEADSYKNLYTHTKMRNVSGINQTEARKSSDMYMKCQYINEITGGKGIIFATGTPISNSMSELYNMQRYLQNQDLIDMDIQTFDGWASTFGENVASVELAPEGTGYRLKTRFSKFYNIPELMNVFREVADIQTEDMLKLPVPKANYRVDTSPASPLQKDILDSLVKRAEKVRNGAIEPNIDNMLKITNDGRKLALDQRLIDPMLPDDPNSKVNVCINNVYSIWEKHSDTKATQLIFCDLSTPTGNKEFNVYDDIKQKLIAKGIPENEIAFIHDAKNSRQKKELFSKVRHGDVRILIGSTSKMGAGTNVQDLVIASHDLDCPWRPRDLEQRRGRSIRQGNKNKEVDVIRYVTEGTFDAYMYQTIENKQKFISQIMTSKNPARSMEDVDETVLSYAEIKMLATGNPLIKEKMDLDISISKLKLQKQNFLDQKYDLENKVNRDFPNQIDILETSISRLKTDIQNRIMTVQEGQFTGMEIDNVIYTDKKQAGNAILDSCKKIQNSEPIPIGHYRGFPMELRFDSWDKKYIINLRGAICHSVELSSDVFGNIKRIDNTINKMDEKLLDYSGKLNTLKEQLEISKIELEKPFDFENELSEKLNRVREVELLIDSDNSPTVKDNTSGNKKPLSIKPAFDIDNTTSRQKDEYER